MSEENNTAEKTNAVYVPKGKGYELFKFLLAARSTDEDRYVLNRVYCDEADDMGVLVTTDSRRIHVLYNVWSYGFQKGVQYLASADSRGISFVPLVNAQETYPNWKGAMPKLEGDINEFEVNTNGKTKNLLVSEIAYKLGSKKAVAVNGEFLVPLCKLPELKIRFQKGGSLIEASGSDGEYGLEYKGVIMGLRGFDIEQSAESETNEEE